MLHWRPLLVRQWRWANLHHNAPPFFRCGQVMAASGRRGRKKSAWLLARQIERVRDHAGRHDHLQRVRRTTSAPAQVEAFLGLWFCLVVAAHTAVPRSQEWQYPQLGHNAVKKLMRRTLAGVGRRRRLAEYLGCPKTCFRPQATCRLKLRLGEEPRRLQTCGLRSLLDDVESALGHTV